MFLIEGITFHYYTEMEKLSHTVSVMAVLVCVTVNMTNAQGEVTFIDVWRRVIFEGATFREKSNKAPRIKILGYKFNPVYKRAALRRR